MSFGYYDADWIDPPERPVYEGPCEDCGKFEACPCGCGWGVCDEVPGEFIWGADCADACESADVCVWD